MSNRRISISIDEYNRLHSEALSQRSAITRLTAEVERLKKEIIGRQAHDRMQVREIKRLTAENKKLGRDYQSARDAHDRVLAENAKLRAALRECEAELNAYYRMEYPGDHPYSQKKLAQAMASNPATVALSGGKP